MTPLPADGSFYPAPPAAAGQTQALDGGAAGSAALLAAAFDTSRIGLAQIDAVEPHRARADIHKTRQQIGQRGFARTRGAHQGHGLAPSEAVEDLGPAAGLVEAEIADHRLADLNEDATPSAKPPKACGFSLPFESHSSPIKR